MNFQLKCLQVTCPPELEEAIRHKVTRLRRLVPETAFIEIELKQFTKSHKQGDKSAEIIVDIPGVKPVIRFVAEGDTFLEAVDRVLDKVDGELGRRRQKNKDHHYKGRVPKEWLADQVNIPE